jgi:hypothetical protein
MIVHIMHFIFVFISIFTFILMIVAIVQIDLFVDRGQ